MKTVNSQSSLEEHIVWLREQFAQHKYLRIDVKNGKQRSPTMNACLHKYCEMVAEQLSDQGLTFTKFFKPGFQVAWTKDIVKDNIWRPVQEAVTGKESTTKPTNAEYQVIYEYVNGKLAEFGIHVPWPTKENMKDERI